MSLPLLLRRHAEHAPGSVWTRATVLLEGTMVAGVVVYAVLMLVGTPIAVAWWALDRDWMTTLAGGALVLWAGALWRVYGMPEEHRGPP